MAVWLLAFIILLLSGVDVGRAAGLAVVVALACVVVVFAAFVAWIGRAAVGRDRVLLAAIIVARLSLGIGALVALFARGIGIALLVTSVVLNIALWAWGRQYA